ncbi:MAG: excinuclease ABC subunit UvrC [Spirochaetales bacterium]|nr:excinuclease ABC subunit UvrC [Spirochaetales bacterium]
MVKDIQDLKTIAAQLPDTPGVYIMKDNGGDIIYVGKALSLKKRVSSYFNANKDTKTRFLVSHIEDIEFIPTRNEYEALVLENNLIKKWKPRYNINLKDGKSYPVIRITNEAYPRVFRTRRIIQDGSEYYGPFPSTGSLDEYLELINRTFPLRKCKGPLKKRSAPCLYHHIGRCDAPCTGKVSAEDYARQVAKVRALLTGKTKPLLKELTVSMKEASAALEFEKAARVRDTIEAIKVVGKEQEVQDFIEDERDYIAFGTEDEFVTFSVFQMRGGKLVGRELYATRSAEEEAAGLLQFLMQYYSSDRKPPEKIYLQIPVDQDLIGAYFQEQKFGKPVFIVPERGRHASVLRMSRENAWFDVQKRKKQADNVEAIRELKLALGLDRLPRRIEGFDIAQLAGTHTVAAMVSFYNGVPDKKNYRHFNIKSLKGRIDDFEAVREAVARRYTRILNEGLERPDLILIDGGKGQVSAAVEILSALGMGDIPLVGLAKREEELFLPGESDPLTLDHTHPGLRVLIWVRDEAHRFGTSFNRQHRKNDIKFSVLENIPGIGPQRSSELLKLFGSLEALAASTPEVISQKASIPLSLAGAVAEEVTAYQSRLGKPS